tara:strand:- start:1989 stop:2996 length:1008 start_codon:yes stop_codon:yes gene_type:complete
MSIRRRGNSWAVDLTSPLGSRYRRSFKTEEAARKWELETKLHFQQGHNRPPALRASSAPPPLTLGELVERTRKRYWKDAKSLNTIESNIKTMVEFFGPAYAISRMDEDAVQSYADHLDTLGLTDATINRKLAVLSRVLRHAARRNWISERVEIPRKKEANHRVIYFSKEDRAEIVRTFQELELPEYADLFTFLCDTGLRLQEALSLEWDDVSNNTVTVWNHKGPRPGGVPMTPAVVKILGAREELDEDWTGPWANLNVHKARYAWERLRTASGRPDWLWHTTRHTFCSRLAMEGQPLTTIRDLARHSDIQTTLRYIHLAPKNLESAIRAMAEGES